MKTCCIIGHRDLKNTKELELKVTKIVADLIEKENVINFLFGSKSKFSDFCYNIVTKYKNTYSNLRRIYVRAEYPIISEDYCNYLKKFYEDSYFYNDKLINNTFSYIKRNQLMIDKSDFCIFYYNKNYLPKTNTKSGTHIAYEYATKKGKMIINVLNKIN